MYKRDVWPYIQLAVEMLKKIEQEEGAISYTNGLLQYWLLAAETKQGPKAFIEAVQQGLKVPLGEKLMSMAEQLIRQGVQQGEAHLLTSQLKAKFKELPETYIKKINRADPATLNQWAINFINAQSLEDIFK